MTIKNTVAAASAALLMSAFAAGPASAAVTFSGSGGSLAASATFTVVNPTTLTIQLTNTSSADVLVPADVLTALFFDIAAGTLTPVSALLAGGSTVIYDPDGQPAGGNVGGEWAYAAGLSGAPYNAGQGISSAGFGLFGQYNFNGPDLSSPTSVNGLNYGIVSAGDNAGTGNGGVTGSGGLIKNSVIFTLSGSGLTEAVLATLQNVSFQYGTALDEPNIVPLPAAAWLLLSGLGGLGLIGRRRKVA